jgi:ribose transport system permease protein
MENSKKRFNIKNLSSRATIGVLIVLIIFLSVTSKVFLSMGNIINVLQQVSINAIVALGMTVVILTGGIDLSVGSVIGFAGAAMATLMGDHGWSLVPTVLVGLAIGIVIGAFNGLMVARFKIQPMIATLATMQIGRGLTYLTCQGRTISGLTAAFKFIGSAKIGGVVPVQIILMILLYALMYFVLRYRKTGRFIYSIGGNEEATRLSGVNVIKYKIVAYTICGFLSSVAAIVLCGKLGSATANAGEKYEMDAVASSVIGGVSLLGGSGSVWGTMMGAVIIGVIQNGMNLLSISTYLQQVVTGSIVLIAVFIDSIKNNQGVKVKKTKKTVA